MSKVINPVAIHLAKRIVGHMMCESVVRDGALHISEILKQIRPDGSVNGFSIEELGAMSTATIGDEWVDFVTGEDGITFMINPSLIKGKCPTFGPERYSKVFTIEGNVLYVESIEGDLLAVDHCKLKEGEISTTLIDELPDHSWTLELYPKTGSPS